MSFTNYTYNELHSQFPDDAISKLLPTVDMVKQYYLGNPTMVPTINGYHRQAIDHTLCKTYLTHIHRDALLASTQCGPLEVTIIQWKHVVNCLMGDQLEYAKMTLDHYTHQALCTVYLNEFNEAQQYCQSCPIYQHTHEHLCHGTHYYRYHNTIYNDKLGDNGDGEGDGDDSHDSREPLFLYDICVYDRQGEVNANLSPYQQRVRQQFIEQLLKTAQQQVIIFLSVLSGSITNTGDKVI